MVGIYRFCWAVRRGSDIEGIFTATEEEIEKSMGQYLYLGEVNGKHSEVDGTVDEGDIVLITNNPEAVAIFNKYSLYSGINPIARLRDQEEDSREDEDQEEDIEQIKDWE